MEDSLWQRGQIISTQGPRLFGVEGYGDERRRDGKLGTFYRARCGQYTSRQQRRHLDELFSHSHGVFAAVRKAENRWSQGPVINSASTSALMGVLARVAGVSKTSHYYCSRSTPVPHIGDGVELLVQWQPGGHLFAVLRRNKHFPALQYIKLTYGSITRENVVETVVC